MNKTYHNDGSFSGTDIKIYAVVNNKFTFNSLDEESTSPVYEELGEIQTISYSIYRDKMPVRALGISVPKGYTRGPVTIAGTMIFTVLHERILHEISNYSIIGDSPSDVIDLKNLRVDQLPPIDIFISFENEYGNKSRLGIFGVEFLNEGQVMSVADLITENSVNYVAKHLSPLKSSTNGTPTANDLAISNSINGIPQTSDDYAVAKQQIQDIRERYL